MRKVLTLVAWFVVALVAAGPVAAQGSAGAASAGACPAASASGQYGDECGTQLDGAGAAVGAAEDSWRAVGSGGGAEAFGEAVEAAGVGNAPVAPASSSPRKGGASAEEPHGGVSPKAESGIRALPETGGAPVSALVAGLLLAAGGLLAPGWLRRATGEGPCGAASEAPRREVIRPEP